MSLFSMPLWKKKKAIALVIWCITLLGLGTGNLINPNLWFDEALQLWASRGQYHYANYDTPQPNTPKAALNANYTNTWDPPGFTLLLNLLGRITGQLWIFRSLTFLFFALGCLILTMLARKWAPQYLLSDISGLVLIASPLLCHYAFEIRPYSMELFHAILAVYLVCCCEASWSRKKCLFFGLLLAFTMASRYPSVFPAVLCATFIAFKFFYQPENPNLFVLDKAKLSLYLCLFLPSLLVGLVIVILMVTHQWQVATASNAFHLLFLIANRPSEVFHWLTLLLWLPMLILITLRVLPLKAISELARKFDLYISFVLALNILRLLLDVGHFIPYGMLSRFNLPCHALLLFTWIPLLLLLLEYGSLKPDNFAWRIHLPAFVVILITLGIFLHAFFFNREDPDPSISYLKKLPIDPPPKILSAINIYPALRYAFEYGSLRDRAHWRDHIYFYGKQYPTQRGWVVREKFAFIASGEMNEVYYQLAKHQQFNLILENHLYLQGGKSDCPGFSTVIVKLD
jgi:hypothetical protein